MEEADFLDAFSKASNLWNNPSHEIMLVEVGQTSSAFVTVSYMYPTIQM
jgi:hypothetical protein